MSRKHPTPRSGSARRPRRTRCSPTPSGARPTTATGTRAPRRRVHAGRLRPRQPLRHLRRLLRRVALRTAGAPRRADARRRRRRQHRDHARGGVHGHHGHRADARRAHVRDVRRQRCRARNGRRSRATCATARAACSRSRRASSASSSAPAPARAATASGASSRRRATTCDGIGRTLQDRQLEIESPPGSPTGSASASAARVTRASSRGPAGDLFVQVGVAPQPGIERDGADLHTIVELTMTQAALGASVNVAGPGG